MRFIFFVLISLPAYATVEYSLCASGCTYTSLQTAIDAAQTYQDSTLCKEVVITATAGETFSGNFTIPSKTCAKYVTVRSSRFRDVPKGQRATSSNTASMALIRTPNLTPVIDMTTGGYWRFEMLEFTKAATGTLMYPLVKIGNSSAKTVAELPHHVIFDRCYIHGVQDAAEVIRAIHLAATHFELLDSTVSQIMGQGIETQGLWCEQGCTEITATNNFIEAATENFLAGGNDGNGQSNTNMGQHPQSGFYFRGNLFSKDPSWKREASSGVPVRACLVDELYQNTSGGQWYQCTVATGTWVTVSPPAYLNTPSQKNMFELKDGRRVKLIGNYFRNTWDHAQGGSIFLVNQTGQASRSYNVEDVENAYNRGENIGAGWNYGNMSYIWTPGNGYVGTPITRASRHNIHNNLITGFFYGGAGTFGTGRVLSYHTVDDMVFRHNSVSGSPTHGIINNSDEAANWRGNVNIIDNVWSPNSYGWLATGVVGATNWCGIQNVVMVAGSSFNFRANALIGGSTLSTTCTGDTGPQLYSGTLPATASDIFTNPASDWTIKSGSPALAAGTGGRDLGADMAMVDGATSTVLAGTLSPWHFFKIRSISPSSTTAAVQFSAPTSSACTVTASTSEAFGATTGTPGATTAVGLARSLSVTALTAATPYWLRVVCGTYEYKERFQTTVSIGVGPTTWADLTNAWSTYTGAWSAL